MRGRERDREAEKEERIFCYARREKKISGGAMYERVFALAVRSIAKIAPNLAKPAQIWDEANEEERGGERRGVVREGRWR